MVQFFMPHSVYIYIYAQWSEHTTRIIFYDIYMYAYWQQFLLIWTFRLYAYISCVSVLYRKKWNQPMDRPKFQRHCFHRRNNRRDRGRLVPPTFRLGGPMGDQQCIGSSQLLGRTQTARNFTASIVISVTRMQNLASELWKIFRGEPRTSQRPSRTQHPARPFAQTLVPWTFQPWLRPWLLLYLSMSY